MKTEYPAETDGHITVAAEIKENLEGIGNRAKPAKHHGYRISVLDGIKSLICKNSKTVGKKDLF